MSSILVSKFSDALTPTAPQRHQNHPQVQDDDTIQLLFRQFHSDQASAIQISDLCKIESKLQTYINKLRLEMENTRQDWQNQEEVLRTEIASLRNTFSSFEDTSSGFSQWGRVSILGSMNCKQLGCVFRSDCPDKIQKHIDTGVHFRFQQQNFVVIDSIDLEAVPAPTTSFKDIQSRPMAIAENLDTSMKSAAISNGTNIPARPVQFKTVHRSVQESQNNLDQHDHAHHSTRSIPLHYQNTDIEEKSLGSQDTARFKCNHCSKHFTRSHTLVEHRRIHKGDRPFGCSQCTKTFTRLKDRNRHQILHSGEKKFICKGTSDTGQQLGCHSSFARKDGLLSHLRSESAFQCIEPLLNVAAQHILRLTNEGGGKDQYCPGAPSGCGLRFQNLGDFKDHYASEAGNACVKSRLMAFALPYFDHRRGVNSSRKTSAGSMPLAGKSTPSSAVKASNDLGLSSSAAKRSPVPAILPSDASGSKIPHTNEPETFDFAVDGFDINVRKLPEDFYSDTSTSIYQTTTSASDCGFFRDPLCSFSISGQPHDIGLRIEGYNPSRGVEGDILQVKVESFVPLLSMVFNIQIGSFLEAVPGLQNMNAIPASVDEEKISPKSFYRYTISARVPYPGNQPRLSPLPIILEINGLQRYGGKILEFLDVGHFTYSIPSI